MHSSLPQQLTNFAFSGSRLLQKVFQTIERVMIRRSRVVIVICPSLEDTARLVDPDARTVLIENAPGAGDKTASPADAAAVRARHGIPPAAPLVVYTGTFEAYQGLDLLFAAMASVRRARPDAMLLLAGGNPEQVAHAKAQAGAAGIGGITVFAGDRPAAEIPAYLLAADVLASSRSRGTNTPLKIYQYLRAGKAIVATRLLTHTQVLSDDTAILTGATADEFAAGILAAIADPQRAASIGARAKRLAETKYSDEAYIEKTRAAVEALVGGSTRVSRVGQVGRVGN
jgi:glycosyltransferase involved in cell wall biosynthesis